MSDLKTFTFIYFSLQVHPLVKEVASPEKFVPELNDR